MDYIFFVGMYTLGALGLIIFIFRRPAPSSSIGVICLLASVTVASTLVYHWIAIPDQITHSFDYQGRPIVIENSFQGAQPIASIAGLNLLALLVFGVTGGLIIYQTVMGVRCVKG